MYDYGGALDSACNSNDPGTDHSGKQLSDELFIVSWKGFPEGQRAIRRWIESGKGIRNFAQADIRHFYSHIQYKIVRKNWSVELKTAFSASD